MLSFDTLRRVACIQNIVHVHDDLGRYLLIGGVEGVLEYLNLGSLETIIAL